MQNQMLPFVKVSFLLSYVAFERAIVHSMQFYALKKPATNW